MWYCRTSKGILSQDLFRWNLNTNRKGQWNIAIWPDSIIAFVRTVSEFAFGRQQGCHWRHGNLCKATKEDSICILFKQLVDISKFVTEPQPNLHILVSNKSIFANAILRTAEVILSVYTQHRPRCDVINPLRKVATWRSPNGEELS